MKKEKKEGAVAPALEKETTEGAIVTGGKNAHTA